MSKTVLETGGCFGCPLRELYPQNTFVAPVIGPSKRMVIAESPGAEEQLEGKPLVGGSGRLFDGLLSKAGVRRSDLTVLNTLQCRPPSNHYPLSPDGRKYISQADAERAVSHCYENHVKAVLKSRAWTRIDTLGEWALRRITGEQGIGSWRGQLLRARDFPELGEIVVPTIHPAALMRDQSFFPVVISDLKKSTIQPPEDYNVYPGLSEVEAFVATDFCFDIENNKYTGEVYMVGLSSVRHKSIVVPFKGAYITQLQRIFREATTAIGQNIIQHDIPLLEAAGVVLNPKAEIWDILLMHHLVSPDLPHDLEFMASVFCSKPRWKHKKDENEELYCARDTDTTLQIYQQLRPLLEQLELTKVYTEVSVPTAKICYHMRKLGVRLDNSRIKEVREKLLAESAELEKLLPEHLRTQSVPIRKRVPAPPGTLGKSKKPIKYQMVDSSKVVTPWRSPEVMAKYLYEELGLDVQKDVKTGNTTTGKIALDKLFRSTQNPAIKATRRLRQIDEDLTTFAKEKMTSVASAHSHFNPHGTNTGRLSSSGPNLQNIPESIRCIYVSHNPGWKILSFDYSQIENRLTAYLANDGERLKRFGDLGFSEHRYAASLFFGIPYDEVEKDNDKDAPYGKAKRIVHGTNYGMGARKISLLYDIPEKEVKALQSKWKAAIYKTSQWQETTARLAKEAGYLRNAFGRKRWFYCLEPSTRVLTTDLKWIPIAQCFEGQKLIGFDESLDDSKYREATVTKVALNKAPRMELCTDKGTAVCTPNHGWPVLIRTRGQQAHYRWMTTEQLRPGDEIAWFSYPWKEERSYEAGRLSGLLDGEGHISALNFRGDVRLTQKQGDVLEDMQNLLDVFGIAHSEPRPTGDHTALEIRCYNTSPRNALEIIGRFQPIRLVQKARVLWDGKPAWGKTRHDVATVQYTETVDDGPIVELSTSTETIIAEGLLCHNTSSYYTESLSFLPQSLGADILLRAMIGLMYERVNWPIERVLPLVPVVGPLPRPANLLLSVHDSVVIESPDSAVDEVVSVVKRVMEQPWRELAGFACPVSVTIGSSWGEQEDYK